NVYRSTVSGGPYTRVASVLTNATFVDGNVTNGVPYFYVVTGLNILGEESGYSGEASARPVSTSPPQLGFAVGNNAIQFNWPQDHTGWELQVQTNSPGIGLGSNWVTVPNSDGTNLFTVPMDSDNSSVFFRLIYH
ncbi:MAG TPA: hypothetical protein VN836_03130, partial [Verrucomicrobiae bacterium]|nr:hypothetical protein [Verrucomicrobiae bacterium]